MLVNVFDVYGVPTPKQVERMGNTFDIDGRYATYYYQVKQGNCKDYAKWLSGFLLWFPPAFRQYAKDYPQLNLTSN